MTSKGVPSPPRQMTRSKPSAAAALPISTAWPGYSEKRTSSPGIFSRRTGSSRSKHLRPFPWPAAGLTMRSVFMAQNLYSSMALQEGQDVVPGHLGLEDVGRAREVSRRAEDADRPLDGAVDIVGAREGHRRLGADAAPEDQAIAELPLDLGDVQALRLDGVEDGDADVDEVGDDVTTVAVAVIADGKAGAGLARRPDDGRVPGLEPFPVHPRAHEHRLLRADVVADLEHVDARLGEAPGLERADGRDPVEEPLGEPGVEGDVGEELRHAAEVPGDLEDRPLHEADDEEAPGVELPDLRLEVGVARRAGSGRGTGSGRAPRRLVRRFIGCSRWMKWCIEPSVTPTPHSPTSQPAGFQNRGRPSG